MEKKLQKLYEDTKEYCNNNNEILLDRAIANEIFYEYDYLKINEYEEVKGVDLTLDDLKKIAGKLLDTYFMNEELNELVQKYLHDYLKELRVNSNE